MKQIVISENLFKEIANAIGIGSNPDNFEVLNLPNIQFLKEEKLMPTEPVMTREEAVAILKKHIPMVENAYKIIEFCIEVGMLEVKEEEEEKPIFEIKYPSGSHVYKIWANGRIEGFNTEVTIINRIPELIVKLK